MTAIELYRKGFKSRGIMTEQEVEETMQEHPEETSYQIIERVIRGKIATETSNIRLYTLNSILMYAVSPQKDAEKTSALKAEIERLDPLFWEEFYKDRK